MRMPVMVDTSALVALYLESDARHREAARVMAELRGKKRPLFATTDVFDETVTLVRRWGGTGVRCKPEKRSGRAGCLNWWTWMTRHARRHGVYSKSIRT